MANTPAYYDTATITAVKSFIVQAPVLFPSFFIRNFILLSFLVLLSITMFRAIGFYSEADTLESSSIPIYSQKKQSIYTQYDRHDTV